MLWQFMQIVSLRNQFAWSVKAYFLEKIRKSISEFRLLKFLPSVLSIEQKLHLRSLLVWNCVIGTHSMFSHHVIKGNGIRHQFDEMHVPAAVSVVWIYAGITKECRA